MIINSINDRCYMTYRENLKLPMHAVERKVKMNIAKNPQFLIPLIEVKNNI